VYLYEGGFATSVWTYLTEVTPVQMSERGEGILELVVNQGDPPGMYCVVPEPKLDDIPDEVELGFEYLVDPCWEVRDDQVATTGLFFIDP
jgi:hypothetical protein